MNTSELGLYISQEGRISDEINTTANQDLFFFVLDKTKNSNIFFWGNPVKPFLLNQHMHSVMINKRRNIHRNVLNPNNRRKQKSVLLTYQQLYDNLYGHEKEKKKKTEALRL